MTSNSNFIRCDASLSRAQWQTLKYLEGIYCEGQEQQSISVKKITINSIILEPVPVFTKNQDGQPGCRPYAEVFNKGQGCQTMPATLEYNSLRHFTTYDEDAALTANPGLKVDGDVTIKVKAAIELFSKMENLPFSLIVFEIFFILF